MFPRAAASPLVFATALQFASKVPGVYGSGTTPQVALAAMMLGWGVHPYP